MDTPCTEQLPGLRRISSGAGASPSSSAAGASRGLPHCADGPGGARGLRGAVRTCVPARSGAAGYREPAGSDPDAHIVRGED
jgi:hypothetical protein